MNNLSNEELRNVEGGAFKLSLGGLLLIGGGILAFAAGVVNGVLRPLTCSSTK